MSSISIEDRQYVSRLIINVLTGKICAREAVLHFPENHKDKTLMAAYHALVHREADEELRRNDILYKDEQDDYLEFIANTLSKGQDLPSNILENYSHYYSDISLKDKTGIKGFVQTIHMYLNIKKS